MQKIEQSSVCVPQAGVDFLAPWMIEGYQVSRTCALAAGSQIFMVSAKVSCHDTVLELFLTCGLNVFVFESLQDAHLGMEYGALRCDLLFFDADNCADVVSAHNIIGKMQAEMPKLSVIVGSASVDTGRNNPVLNYLLYTAVCLPTDDQKLLNAVAVAVIGSLR